MRTLSSVLLLLLASCVSTPDVEGVIQGPPGAVASIAGPGSGIDPGIEPEDESGVEPEVSPDPERAGAPAEGTSGPLPTYRTPDLRPQTFTRAELANEAEIRRGALDSRCRELLPTAREEDATYEELMAASRALVFNADLRIQTDVALRFDPENLPKTSALIDAEDDVPSALKGEVRSLAQESRDLADRALKLRPGDAAADLFNTLGIGLSLWTMGPFQALTNGAATTLPRRIKQVAEEHPEFEGASPLRLKGRFASRAPWPYKDKAAGVEALERAVEIGPIPLNLLFLGDAYWINGNEEAAIATWERGAVANADLETEISSPFLREICRLRSLSTRRK